MKLGTEREIHNVKVNTKAFYQAHASLLPDN